MTAQPLEQPAVRAPWPAKSLGDVTRVITSNASDDVRADFTAALESAWAQAKSEDSLQPLLNLVEVWWPQAVFWSEPEKARRVLAEVADIQANGLGDRPRRPFDREQFIAKWEERHGQKLNV